MLVLLFCHVHNLVNIHLVLATGPFLCCIYFALRQFLVFIAVLRLAWSLFYLLGMLLLILFFWSRFDYLSQLCVQVTGFKVST